MAVRCAVYQFVLDNQEKLNSVILYDRDMSYDYFAYKVCDSRSSPVVTLSPWWLKSCPVPASRRFNPKAKSGFSHFFGEREAS